MSFVLHHKYLIGLWDICMYSWVGNKAVEKLNLYIRAFGLIVSTGQLTTEKEIFRMQMSLTIKGFYFFFPQQNV